MLYFLLFLFLAAIAAMSYNHADLIERGDEKDNETV